MMLESVDKFLEDIGNDDKGVFVGKLLKLIQKRFNDAEYLFFINFIGKAIYTYLKNLSDDEYRNLINELSDLFLEESLRYAEKS